MIVHLQAEIIATCKENMRCLKAVLLSPDAQMLTIGRHEMIRGEFVSILCCDCADFCHFFEFVLGSFMEFTEFLIDNWPLSKLLVEIMKNLRFYRLLPICI